MDQFKVIFALRAEWATLDNPARLQALARRHLQLRPADASQYDPLTRLPERAPVVVQPKAADAVAAMIGATEGPAVTGSASRQARSR